MQGQSIKSGAHQCCASFHFVGCGCHMLGPTLMVCSWSYSKTRATLSYNLDITYWELIVLTMGVFVGMSSLPPHQVLAAPANLRLMRHS
jgi:hypothetical protein